MFAENEPSAWLQHATHLLKGRLGIRNRAQAIRHEHRIEACIRHRDTLGGALYKLKRHAQCRGPRLRQPPTRATGVYTHYRGNTAGIVVRQVVARAHADLQHRAMRQRHHFLTLLENGFSAASTGNKSRNYNVTIKAHLSYSSLIAGIDSAANAAIRQSFEWPEGKANAGPRKRLLAQLERHQPELPALAGVGHPFPPARPVDPPQGKLPGRYDASPLQSTAPPAA